MNDTPETAPAAEAPVVAPISATKPKKAAKKPAKKATPAKKEPSSKVEFDAKGRRLTLRNPQVLILTALAASKKGPIGGQLTRAEILTKCPGVGMSEHLGTLGDSTNQWTVSLLEQKFVKQEQHDINGKDVVLYTITATGRKALEKAK